VRISTRGRYGLKALIDIAERADGSCVTVASIAQREGISEHYLEQIVAALKKAGLVKSVRGAQGGYVLNQPADCITVAEVMRVLEGPLYPVDCVADSHADSCGSGDCAHCATKPIWEKLYKSINSVLESYKLSDLAQPAESCEPEPDKEKDALEEV
jgi:Rrf2 family protein